MAPSLSDLLAAVAPPSPAAGDGRDDDPVPASAHPRDQNGRDRGHAGERAPVPADDPALLDRFLDYVAGRRLQLYPTQEEAILELFGGGNVILNTPTGSGKSLVATALHFRTVAAGGRSVYTAPIKALVNEKWRDLCREFGPERVGLSTGDATVNRDAPILCCTAEILANIALREGARAPVTAVSLDEFHYYADRDRGTAWQVPLLALPQTQFLLMSATLGDTSFFQEELARLTGRPTVTVQSRVRPVPLEFAYAETPLTRTLEELVAAGKCPVYVVHFTQRDAAKSAQDLTSTNLCTREEKAALADALVGTRFTSPYGPEIKKWLRHGIGLHHAGLLPRYRVLVEQLAQRGLLKVICGTDTLGVGINVPLRTVLFTRLCKYDGRKTAILSARDFHQIAGRAGRKGYDDRGWVVAQAPEHVIENLQLEQKLSERNKKYVKRKPPEKNFVNWDKQTFQRLTTAPPERLTSQFRVTAGMLLQVLGRTAEDGCEALRDLIRRSHEPAAARQAHRRRAWQLFRALFERRIIEVVPPSPAGVKLRLNVDLQSDFSLDQSLALYVHDTIPLLDPQSPDYPLVLLSLVEAILENPEPILQKQLDRVKTAALAEMKQRGVEFDARMEELDKLEYPKPNRDFIYETFNAFANQHPWLGQENIRPKSVAREMFEEFRSFSDYVKDYELPRVEGLLLRYLTSVFKALTQTVPDAAKNDVVREMELYLGTMLRQVDSTLLDEWEKLRDPDYQPADPGGPEAEVRPPGAEEARRDPTRDPKGFTAAVRTLVFAFLRACAGGDFEAAREALLAGGGDGQDPEGQPWTPERLRDAVEAYLAAGHLRIRLDPAARNVQHTHVAAAEDDPTRWRVEQTLVDPEEANDWVAAFDVDLAESRRRGEPALRLRRIGSLVP